MFRKFCASSPFPTQYSTEDGSGEGEQLSTGRYCPQSGYCNWMPNDCGKGADESEFAQSLNDMTKSPCYSYAQLVSDPLKRRELWKGHIERYFQLHKPDENNPHVEAILSILEKNPGIADDVLKNACSKYTRNNLKSSTSSNLKRFCGCFLPEKEYTKFEALEDPRDRGSHKCDPACVYPGTIKPYDSSTGGFKQCNNTNCIIDDFTVYALESDIGDIYVEQVCQNCQTGRCVCYVPHVKIISEMNEKMVDGTMSAKCDICLKRGTSDIDPEIYDCKTGKVLQTTALNSSDTKKNVMWVVVIILSVLIVVIVLYNFFANKKY